MSDAELIRVKFDGGLASTGQLHFYEYSRSQYATARFVATIEHFRRTGRVAERITVNSNIDIIINTPKRGSFVEDLFVPALQQGMAAVISTPLSSLISYVWHLIAPRSEKTDSLIDSLAKIRLAEIQAEIQKASLDVDIQKERERTEQLNSLRGIISDERATTKQALELLKWAIESSNMAIQRSGINTENLIKSKVEIEAEQQREGEFKEHIEQLENVGEDSINKLTSRIRPMITEMALPLRRSADRISLSHGEAKTAYAHLDDEVVKAIQKRKTEEVIVEVIGHVKSYDRDNGIGKIISDQLHRTLNFVVPIADRRRLRESILEAMRIDKVKLLCRRVIDDSGLPTSLILIEVDTDIEGLKERPE
ncbi:MAG: hypothetical protein ACK40A_00290 [Pannonibacter indicus]